MRPKFLSVLALVPLALFALCATAVAGSPPTDFPDERPAEYSGVFIGTAPEQCVGDACAPVCSGDSCAAAPRRSVVHQAAPRRLVVNQTNNITVVSGSAQADAEAMAATGRLRHQGNSRGCREGIGYSTSGPDDAVRRCCYYGRYRAREIGVARGARGWFACVRYE
jgi:hypothetical protein